MDIVFDAVPFIMEIDAETTGTPSGIAFDRNVYLTLPQPTGGSGETVSVS